MKSFPTQAQIDTIERLMKDHGKKLGRLPKTSHDAARLITALRRKDLPPQLVGARRARP